VDLRPDHVDAYYVLGLAYEQLSDFEKALEAYRLAIAIQERRNSRSDIPHLYLGRLLIALARYGESIAELEKAVHLKPDGHDAWTELGRAMIEAGRVGREGGGDLRRLPRLEQMACRDEVRRLTGLAEQAGDSSCNSPSDLDSNASSRM
jgi:tetratricopeptide (TPR) repeat protein